MSKTFKRTEAFRSRRWLAAPVAVAAAVAAGGVALASIPGPRGVSDGCYNKTTGGLRLIDPAKGQKCKVGEGAVSWNQAGINWRDTWAKTTAYRAGDAVAYLGSSYLAVASSAGKDPAVSPAAWALLAARGGTGSRGPRGPRGPQGAPPAPDLERVASLNWWGGAYIGGSYGFNQPDGIAFDGTHLWVTNSSGDTVTEFNSSDGSLVQNIGPTPYGFSQPDGIAFDGITDLWVTNFAGASVTEISMFDGSHEQTLSASKYGFNDPAGIASDGTNMWVANYGNSSVTEFAPDGTLVRTLTDSSYEFSNPDGVASDGTHVWVTNRANNTVTEINASDGSLVQVLKGSSYQFDQPVAIAFDGTHMWVANQTGNSVTDFPA
jgi:hypothetical protein